MQKLISMRKVINALPKITFTKITFTYEFFSWTNQNEFMHLYTNRSYYTLGTKGENNCGHRVLKLLDVRTNLRTRLGYPIDQTLMLKTKKKGTKCGAYFSVRLDRAICNQNWINN